MNMEEYFDMLQKMAENQKDASRKRTQLQDAANDSPDQPTK